MYIFLVVVAIFVGFIGLLFLSQASQGVGFIGFACLLGILARIVQASVYNTKNKTSSRINVDLSKRK